MLSICLLFEIYLIQQQDGTIQVWQPNVNKASPNEYKTFEITFAQHADMKFSINDYCLNGSLHCRVLCRTWEDNVLAILCTKLTYKSNKMKTLKCRETSSEICGRRQLGTRLAQILRIREYNNCSSHNIMAFAAARMILKDKRRKPSREEYSSPRNRSKVYILHTQIQWWMYVMWFHSLSSVLQYADICLRA